MKNNWITKLWAVLLCTVLCISWIPVADARGPIEVDRRGTMTLDYKPGETTFSLYYVALVDAYANFTYTDDFDDYALEIPTKDGENWKALADTLAIYADADELVPDRLGITDQEGTWCFDDLPTGMYLLTGEEHMVEDQIVTPKPSLICLPSLAADDFWLYDLVISPKYTLRQPPKETTQVSVLKLWKDNGYEESRPESITVELLCDGEVYDTVELSQDNNWSHVWTDLLAEFQWSVREIEEENYTVLITQDANQFVITNTVVPETPENPPEPPDIPQTGQLWWPVPVLAALGTLLVLVGILTNIKKKCK